MNTNYPSSDQINQAAEVLKSGGLVSFPTETVYGLGANALDSKAVEKIYQVKNRPATNPLIVHTYCLENIFLYSQTEDTLIKEKINKLSVFWPGPLTVILKKANSISPLVSAGGDSIALRIPNHAVAIELLKASNLPLAAPSANPSGYISPTKVAHVKKMLGDRVDMILDGGECKVGIESTVLNLLTAVPEILRPGSITKEQIESVLGEEVRYSSAGTAVTISPGQLKEHYSPNTPLKFRDQVDIKSLSDKKIGRICFEGNHNLQSSDKVVDIIISKNADDIAARLYSAMHELDQLNLDLILVERIDEHGIGIAIMDRLKRAAAK